MSSFVVGIEFSELVKFTASDVKIENGTCSQLTGSGVAYSLLVETDDNKDVMTSTVSADKGETE